MSNAKFTEYLGDYLLNNELPTEFEEIDGFTDQFVAKFVDREIGFETETLFKIKLSLKASIVIPVYKQRINQLQVAISNIPITAKTINEHYSEGGNNYSEIGKQHSTTTELPLNELSALPNIVQDSDATSNVSNYKNERNYTREEKGLTTLENYEVIERLQGDLYIIMNKLLNQFEPLFMGVF